MTSSDNFSLSRPTSLYSAFLLETASLEKKKNSWQWLHKTLQLASVRADMRGAAYTNPLSPSVSHKLCDVSVLNGVELILHSEQQSGEHLETSEGLAPTSSSYIPLPQPKEKMIIVI